MKIHIMRNILFSALLCLVVFSSCKKEESTAPIDPISEQETYSSVKSILETSCVDCHSPNGNASYQDFTTYANIKTYLDGANTMIDRLNSDDETYRMPPTANLSQSDKQKLIDWINSGYSE